MTGNIKLDDFIAELPADEQAEIAEAAAALIAGDPWKGCLGGNLAGDVCPGCGKTRAEIAEASETGHCPHMAAF